MNLQNIGKEKLLIIFLSVIIISIIGFYYFYTEDRIDLEEGIAAEEYGEENKGGSDNPETDADTGKIYIHIGGEVERPGVVVLETGARLFEAIQAAGGATDKADLKQINLASVVTDQQKILVPGQGNPTEAGINPSGGYSNGNQSDDGKININTANASELMNLPGIGESIAESIISYRESNNGFKNIEEIKNVNRIGDKTFEKMKDLIKIQ